MSGFPEPTARRLFHCPIVHVFRVPPRTADGCHYAKTWDDEVWAGQLEVRQRGDTNTDVVLSGPDGTLFARSPLAPGSCERSTDSSRYFVLRIVQEAPGGGGGGTKTASVGIAFNERDEAFDFNVAMQGAQKDLDRASRPDVPYTDAPPVNMAIKTGQKITVNFAGGSGKAGAGKAKKPPSAGGGFLAPPARDTKRVGRSGARAAAAPAAAAAPTPPPPDELESLFTVPPAAAAAASDPFAAPAPAATAAGDPFAVAPAPAPAPAAAAAGDFAADMFGGSGGGLAAPAPAAAAGFASAPADPFAPKESGGAFGSAFSAPSSDPFSAPKESGAFSATPTQQPFLGGSDDPFAVSSAPPARAPAPAAASIDPFGGAFGGSYSASTASAPPAAPDPFNFGSASSTGSGSFSGLATDFGAALPE